MLAHAASSLRPFRERTLCKPAPMSAAAHGADLFVVTEMSHPGAELFMAPLAEKMARLAVEVGAAGVVAPATRPERIKLIRSIMGEQDHHFARRRRPGRLGWCSSAGRSRLSNRGQIGLRGRGPGSLGKEASRPPPAGLIIIFNSKSLPPCYFPVRPPPPAAYCRTGPARR